MRETIGCGVDKDKERAEYDATEQAMKYFAKDTDNHSLSGKQETVSETVGSDNVACTSLSGNKLYFKK